MRLDQVTDGTSNTLMMGEDLPEYNNHSAAFYSNGDWGSCNIPLNYMPDPPTPASWWYVMSFRSRHPGGAFFCLADGSVRFLSETIDSNCSATRIGLYQQLSTRAGGEPVTVP